MSEQCYWVLRCDNQFFIVTDETRGKTFPHGHTTDFGPPGSSLLIGSWHGLPCYATEIEQEPEAVPGGPTLLSPFYRTGRA